MLNAVSEEFTADLRARLPGKVFARGAEAYGQEFFDRATGRPDNLILAPGCTEEVSLIMRVCCDAGVAVVPYGGGTGLVQGHIAPELPPHVVLTLERMNAIRAVSPRDNTLIAEAGVILHAAQIAAEGAGRLFPLSIASEGSAQIGGILATNAGGVNVLRYGNARDLCLGIEAVLADGSVLHGLGGLRKDNTGYDIRHLLIGSEGTLGIITAAVLRLFPQPREMGAALAAVPDPAAALDLLGLATEDLGQQLSAFELIRGISIDFCAEAGLDLRLPFTGRPDWMVLLDVGSAAGEAPAALLEDLLSKAMERGLILDGAIAQSGAQRQAFWDFRERIPEANRHARAISNHDVSLSPGRLPEFIADADAVIAGMGDFRVNCVGHMGDGNLHFNVFPPRGARPADYADRAGALGRAVNDVVARLGGSISAEHGIGRKKVADYARYVDPTKRRMVAAIKDALDPRGILNPGVLSPR